MSVQSQNEVWQVEVGGQIYEAAFEELGGWIGDGALHPADKVRKGNLRWVEARLVPGLIPFFNAKERGEPMPVVVATDDSQGEVLNIGVEPVVTETSFEPPALETEAVPTHLDTSSVSPHHFVPEPVDHSIATPAEPAGLPDPNSCAIHAGVESTFVCDGCGNGFCRACPNSYGGSVKICPLCGAMCKTLSAVVEARVQTEWRSATISEGFGSNDFFAALRHPFKFKASLIFGCLMFMFFSIGQAVTSLGGIYMIVAAIFSIMLSNMLTFGILSHTVESFAHGHLEANFMPDFEDFEIWDSVIHPFFLSIGAYLSSFGPFFLVLIIGTYVVFSSVSSQMETFRENVEKIPGTHYYDSQRTLDQSEDVKGVIGNINREQLERLDRLNALAEAEQDASAEEENAALSETREQEELWASAQQQRAKGLESALGKSPETEAKERSAMVQAFLSLAPPLVVIGAIFFLWGLFYFPVACAIAGYTRSFGATINPLIGLDTIKRLGSTYVKILMMALALLVASVIVSVFLAAVFSAFDLPGFGNLPAKAIGAIFSFYFWIVFSCVLGYAIFKRSDALQIKS